MIDEKLKSTCCNAPVIVGGNGTTHYYVCTYCNHPCDITEIKENENA